MKRMLIIGGAGFIGSNAALYFAEKGWEVAIMDNLSRSGTESNLQSLMKEAEVTFFNGDVRRSEDLDAVFSAFPAVDAVLHLAAQVAVTTSVIDPVTDFQINALGTFNVLEAVRRHAPKSTLIYASTNKVYGGLENRKVVLKDSHYQFEDDIDGITEEEPLDFHSPYGCSKGAADQYVRDYARIYGLRTFVIRQSCIYGIRQYGVEDQGWVAWFTIAAILGKKITIYGDGKQVRDVLWVTDLLELYDLCLNSDVASGIYNAGGGSARSVSVQDVVDLLQVKLDQPFPYSYDDWRPGDQKLFVSDNSKALADLGWSPRTSFEEGMDKLVKWVVRNVQAIREVGQVGQMPSVAISDARAMNSNGSHQAVVTN